MIVGFGQPKKVPETLWLFVFYFVLCKKCTGEKKCSLVVVLSVVVIELAKVIKSAKVGRRRVAGTLWHSVA